LHQHRLTSERDQGLLTRCGLAGWRHIEGERD
jgi:hypothetical protein